MTDDWDPEQTATPPPVHLVVTPAMAARIWGVPRSTAWHRLATGWGLALPSGRWRVRFVDLYSFGGA
mgnify:FL=1